jgi:hypothetical protein
MVKKLFSTLLISVLASCVVIAQGGFTIKQYNVIVKVNKDASLDIDEDIYTDFYEEHHGIFRKIPFRYPIQQLPPNTEKAGRQLESNGYTKTIIEDINVEGWDYSVSNEGDDKIIKIGNKKNYVFGEQEYKIHYRILNAINFFKDKSELYFNVIGNSWPVTINKVNFSIELYDALPMVPSNFIATGQTGSQENKTTSTWSGNKIFSGNSSAPLQSGEGLTVGIVFPKDFLIKPDFTLLGIKWAILPAIVFLFSFLTWRRWGKDEKLTITTEFYPPKGLSPGVAGYIIDDRLDRRDLTALVPYWGGGGYLKIKELEKKDYEFLKIKELPETALEFEKTLFNGIFANGETVLYLSMNKAKAQLESRSR